jgi:hypothetical protein
MATTTNFGWTTPDDTDLVKDGAAAIRTLGSSIDTSLVDLKGGTTGQVLTKASNTDLDFSFTTPASLPITTEGDLIIGDATGDAVRLPIGALGTVLTSDGDTADWAAPAAAGGMTLLSTTAITATSTISITGIDQTYNELVIVVSNAATVATNNNAALQFNTDTGTNYTWGFYDLISNTTTGNANTSEIRWLNGATTTTNVNNINAVIRITRYSDTTPNKVIEISCTYIGGTTSIRKALTVVGSYRGTSGISSIQLLGAGGQDYTAQGNVYIYGVK